MKLDKSKRTIIGMLCLYVAIGIVAVIIFANFGSKTSRNRKAVSYSFEDDGKAGATVDIANVNVIGDSGVQEEEVIEEPEEVIPEPTPEPVVEPEKVYYKFKVATNIHHLRVRQEPDMDGKILYYLEKGEEGYVLLTDGDWSLVTNGTIVGYSANEYLELTEITEADLPDYFPDEYK